MRRRKQLRQVIAHRPRRGYSDQIGRSLQPSFPRHRSGNGYQGERTDDQPKRSSNGE